MNLPGIFFQNFQKCQAPKAKRRNKMGRVPRIHIENALYYVTSRGDHNDNIFRNEADYNAYIDLVKKNKEESGFKLFAFCLLPNHLHLLLEIKGDVTISDIMHGLTSTYTKYFNSKYKEKGHLFQERYRLVLAEKAPYMGPITAYMHLNPKVLGITQEPEAYPYSTYSSYLYYSARGAGAGQSHGINIDNEIKEVLKTSGVDSYKDIVNRISKEQMDNLGKELNKKSIIGSDEFVEKIKSRVEEEKLKATETRPSAIDNTQRKVIIVVGSLVILLMGFFAFRLYTGNLKLKENVRAQIKKQDKELKVKLVKEKEAIRKDLDEKYRADIVSYEAMAKRLEIEKKKVKDLEKNTTVR